jgi:TatA/E family protein of Tat protein translocase
MPLAFLDGIGAMEMLLVGVVGLLLFGGKGLPDMARTLGRVIREFKKATQGVEEEVRRVIHEEPPPPRPRPAPRALPKPASPPPPAPAKPLTEGRPDDPPPGPTAGAKSDRLAPDEGS